MSDDSFKEQVLEQFKKINTRLDGIDTRLDGMDGRLDRIDGQLASLAASQVEMEKRLTVRLERIEKVAYGNQQTLSRIGHAFQPVGEEV